MPMRKMSVLQAQPERPRKPLQSTKMSKLLSALHWACLGRPIIQSPESSERPLVGQGGHRCANLVHLKTPVPLPTVLQKKPVLAIILGSTFKLALHPKGPPLRHSAALCAPDGSGLRGQAPKPAAISTQAAPAAAVIA